MEAGPSKVTEVTGTDKVDEGKEVRKEANEAKEARKEEIGEEQNRRRDDSQEGDSEQDSLEGEGVSEEVAALGELHPITEAEKARLLEEKNRKKQLYSQQFGNCFRNEMSKQDREAARRACRAVKHKAQKERAKANKRKFLDAMTPEEREAWIEENGTKLTQERNAADLKLKNGRNGGARVIVDCAFENTMNAKELKSLGAQINYMKLRMRSSQQLYHLAVVNYKGAFVEISKERNIPSWDWADLEPESLTEYMKKQKLQNSDMVYLSPDAEEELDGFDKTKTYIIGGIVDSTINLHQTKEKAADDKIVLRKLPLEPFRRVKSFRPCLNINTVFEIMDNYHSNGGDLHAAILSALPLRFKEEYALLTASMSK